MYRATVYWRFILVIFSLLSACSDREQRLFPEFTGRKSLLVNDHQVDCEGLYPTKCLLIKDHPDEEWRYHYGGIEGFDYDPGFIYLLEVNIVNVPDPLQDQASFYYELVKVVSKH